MYRKMDISPKFEYIMNPIMKPEMVRAEIFQIQDLSCFFSEIECKPDWVYASEEFDSETNKKQAINNMDVVNLQQNVVQTTGSFLDEKKEANIFLCMSDATSFREISKDSHQNGMPSLELTSETSPVTIKHQDYDIDASWENDFKGIHEDGLHMPPKLWNDPDTDIKPENSHRNSLEENSKVRQKETENEASIIGADKELSGITISYSLRTDGKESGAFKKSQRRKNSTQMNNEVILPYGSRIFQRKDQFSALPEDDNCNNVKSTSEIGIQVGLTEEVSCMMELGTNPASGKQIVISCIERVKSKRDANELPTDFFPMDGESVLEEQFRTDKDHNCKKKPEDFSDEFRNVLDSVQDTIVEGDAISHKSEEEYQPINPYSTKDHNDIHKIENSSFNFVCGPNYPKQLEHGEKKITQCDEYMDLSRKPVRINSVEEFCEMEGLDHVDFMNKKESKANDVEGKFCDSRISETDIPQHGLIFPEISLEKLFQEEGSLFHGKNQEFSFKMKTYMYSDYVKRPQSWGFYQEKLALILKMFLGCLSIMNGNTRDTVNLSGKSEPDRNTSKRDKFGENEVNCKEDIKFSRLKDITSTWYFFPMFARFMDYCLPSSLQIFFERLIRGIPISQAERMSYEWLRLDSFNTLPSSFRGTAIRLAQSGFYYTRQGTRIRCYACNVEHEGWNNTDDPHELHQRISPTCPFLRGNPTYPNYPIIPDTVHSGNTTERSASSATPVTSVIQERTQSRVIETPQVIIPSINTSSTLDLDEVSIPQVEARRESTTTHDSSISQTQQNNSNPITATSQPETIPSSSSMNHPQQPTDDAENRRDINHGNFVLTIPAKQVADPGVNPMPQTISERPKHPEHAPLSSRISSYTSWPVRLDQTPQQMAEAGFFYAGINDYTRCFHCGGGLRNWEPGDNPWIEHARWYPHCAYVLGKKGQKFVNAVLKKQTELLAAQNAERNVVSTTTNTTVTSGSGTSSKSTTVQQPITQSGNLRYFQNPNENDIATKLIDEMGYQRERVREVILEVRRRRGQQEIAIEHAIELLVADEERKTTAGRQNEASTLHELIQESERLVLHDDCSPHHPLSSTSLPPAPPPTAAAGSFQHDGHQHQDVGGRSSGQQQSGQTNQSTGLGRNASLAQIRQNTSGPLSIAVDVSSSSSSSSSSFGNQEGHQRNNSTAAGGSSAAATLLEPTSLPALDPDSLREEYLRLRDQNVCKICMERKIDLVFLPCGHLVSCQICGESLRICPICRAKINGSAKTYLS